MENMDMTLFHKKEKKMKKSKIMKKILLLMIVILSITSCAIKTDDLEDATIYTTVYPINYITNYLYKDHGNIESIYPKDCDLNKYKLTEKQIKNYAKSDLFIYNGLTEEKEIAKNLINKNNKLLIIDASYGLTLQNDITELWLSPNNYLMLAKNIKENLQEYLTSKFIIEEIENNYNDFEEKISLIDASLHTIGKNASENNKNIIVVSNNTFKFLENYGFKIISLSDENNLKENKLKTIKNNFKSSKYKYILVADIDKENELIKDLIDNYSATKIDIDTLTLTLQDDYFDIMTQFTENIKNIVS